MRNDADRADDVASGLQRESEHHGQNRQVLNSGQQPLRHDAALPAVYPRSSAEPASTPCQYQPRPREQRDFSIRVGRLHTLNVDGAVGGRRAHENGPTTRE